MEWWLCGHEDSRRTPFCRRGVFPAPRRSSGRIRRKRTFRLEKKFKTKSNYITRGVTGSVAEVKVAVGHYLLKPKRQEWIRLPKRSFNSTNEIKNKGWLFSTKMDRLDNLRRAHLRYGWYLVYTGSWKWKQSIRRSRRCNWDTTLYWKAT